MTDFYENWKKQSEAYKPKEVDQGVLWLKQMALMSPHFKELRDDPKQISVNERWMNAFGQMCYDLGRTNIDQDSYDQGFNAAWQEVAKRLDMTIDD